MENSYEDYYQTVVGYLNIPPKTFNETHKELNELINTFYYKEVPFNKAVIMIENFYNIYKKYLNA